MKKLLFSSFIFLSLSAFSAEKWKLTTLEWPPFTCEKCKDQGAGAKALREALKSVGVDLELEFLPWSRAIKVAAEPAYVGYFPAWPEDVIEGFSGSSSIFQSPIGFVENTKSPIKWEKLEDLKGMTIGVVQDYGNTPDFMAMVKKGDIKSDVVASDDINVKKVAAERLKAAIIDVNNLKYMLQNDLKDANGKVQMNAKILANKDLLIALTKSAKSEAHKAKLEEGLKKINAQKIVDDYLKETLK